MDLRRKPLGVVQNSMILRSMTRYRFDPWEDEADRGPFDPDPEAEPDLWFSPPPEDAAAATDPPGPDAGHRRLIDPHVWRAAQDRHSGALADLAALFGALDERLHAGPEGWRHRLALLEVADLGWWTGARVPMDQLALWVGLRRGATGEEAQELIRAGWAVRRLSGGPGLAGGPGPADGPGPTEGGWQAGLAAFLGRGAPGAAVPDSVCDMAQILSETGSLHPVTQAAILFHAWRRVAQGAAVDVEAAVLAARHGAGAGRGAALFLPLALSGSGALRATGTEQQRLGAWIAGAAQAVLAALLHLDRLRDWQGRARAATAGLSGRTPPALIAALVDWPMISAPLAEQITGASRAAVQRNLDTLAARGLIREVTGQGRFRVWAARI